ncbi:MAG: tRNA (guanosine(46)-N7)-methyltransferase TrmB [Bacteroidales bacterium]
MGKNKLERWREMKTFGNCVEPSTEDIKTGDYHLKGKWADSYFKNQNPVVLELGCGKGEYTVAMAEMYPGKNFAGLDIKGARIWRGAKTAYQRSASNVLFIRTRIEFITSFFAENEVDEIWITFPDPFTRQRDSGKRLTSPGFLNNYRSFLRHKGIVHLKTDNHELYKYTRRLAEANGLEIIAATSDLYTDMAGNDLLSVRTHYESIFLKEGKKIHYLSFRLEKDKEIKDATLITL